MQDLVDKIIELVEDEALILTQKYLTEGRDSQTIFEAYQAAMTRVGDLFEKKEYFVPELIMAGDIMGAGFEIIKPHLKAGASAEAQKWGKVLVATVEGDIHDIGKNIAVMMMDMAGLEIRDMGVDVPAGKILKAARLWSPDIIGLSGMLSMAFDSMKEVVDGLSAAGLRDQVKVIIGGGRTNEQVRQYVGADVYATDALINVAWARKWLGKS